MTIYVLGNNTELYKDAQRRLSILYFVDGICSDVQFPAWMIPTDNAKPSVSRQETLLKPCMNDAAYKKKPF